MLQQLFEEIESQNVFPTVKYSGVADNVIIVVRPVSFYSALEKDARVLFVAQHDEIEQDFLEVSREKAGVAFVDAERNFLIRSENLSGELYSDAAFQRFLVKDSQINYVVHGGYHPGHRKRSCSCIRHEVGKENGHRL